ncbi:MAG: hypothetical protein DBX47_05815 [Clostridiales bacterium]|nr:MAG: hypothetical protein DBX47_05815 [Clostridiales bacterium]
MGKNSFKDFAANKKNYKWKELISRQSELYDRPDDIRSPFARDYTRILHSLAYRRLKHKTQVFFNIENDHVCTRMEHVAHVESVSNTIARFLGLNDELTKAIAIGHDLGHAPFGHQGEEVIQKLTKTYLDKDFWHEKNGLRFVDKIELLEDNYNKFTNLDLTYAVRDGIVSHCGEVDENGLNPRDDFFDLEKFEYPGQYQPATWEGCIVKIADKISYIGRDIEDAARLGFLSEENKVKLLEMARANDEKVLNTTVIMHNMIIDICKNSTPEKGICLSPQFIEQLNELKNFNYEYIYKNKRLLPFQKYSEIIITQIFDELLSLYDKNNLRKLMEKEQRYFPILMDSFESWLAKYCEPEIISCEKTRIFAESYINEKIYSRLEDEKIYIQAVLDYIAGMTDRFAIKLFEEMLTYRSL